MQDAKGLDKYAPYNGANIRTSYGNTYELFVMRTPDEPWSLCVSAANAALAWTCMSYIRQQFRVPCKVIKKGAST